MHVSRWGRQGWKLHQAAGSCSPSLPLCRLAKQMPDREWLLCGYVTGWPCRNHFKVGTYPPGLVPIGPCCWPNLRIFVYRILGEAAALSPVPQEQPHIGRIPSSRIESGTTPGPAAANPVATDDREVHAHPRRSKKWWRRFGIVPLGCCCRMSDTAQLALRKAQSRSTCPARPPSCRLACWARATTIQVTCCPRVRFPAIAILDASPRLYTRGQERNLCASVFLLSSFSLSHSLHDNHTHTIPYTIHFRSCIPPAAVVSLLACYLHPLLCSPYPQQVVWHI